MMATVLCSGGWAIKANEKTLYFAGYDFMGSVEWVENPNDAIMMSFEEAEQILADLLAAE